jgi:hypothetical protein
MGHRLGLILENQLNLAPFAVALGMLCLVLGMRVSRLLQSVLGIGLLAAGCILNPQPLPPEDTADSGSTSFGNDAAAGGDANNTSDSGKGVDAADASDGAPEAGDASDGASDAMEEGG